MGGYYAHKNLKKKRPGQRSRKAKALAIEAFKSGRKIPPNKSFNWRERKKIPKHIGKSKELIAGLNNSIKTSVSDVANMGRIWKENGNTHPSWAAKKIGKI